MANPKNARKLGGGWSPHQSDATVLEFLVASESALALGLVWVLRGEPRAARTNPTPPTFLVLLF